MIAPYWQQLEHELAGTGLSMYPALAWISATALFVAIFALVKGVIGMGRKILRMAARSGPARPELSAKAARRTGSWFLGGLAAAAAAERPALSATARTLFADIVVTALFVQAAVWGHARINCACHPTRTIAVLP